MSRIPVRSHFPNPLGDSSRKTGFGFLEDVLPIFLAILPGIFAVSISFLFAYLEGDPESPRTRQVILDVPEKSSVDAQVTSGNNTVNLQNL